MPTSRNGIPDLTHCHNVTCQQAPSRRRPVLLNHGQVYAPYVAPIVPLVVAPVVPSVMAPMVPYVVPLLVPPIFPLVVPPIMALLIPLVVALAVPPIGVPLVARVVAPPVVAPIVAGVLVFVVALALAHVFAPIVFPRGHPSMDSHEKAKMSSKDCSIVALNASPSTPKLHVLHLKWGLSDL